MYYIPYHYQFFYKLEYKQKEASETMIEFNGSSKQIVGYFDERGVPYLFSTKDQRKESNEIPYTSDCDTISNEYILDLWVKNMHEYNRITKTLKLHKTTFDPSMFDIICYFHDRE